MRNKFKKLPILIAGLMLGLAVLVNLVSSYHEGLKYLTATISVFIGLLLIAKFIINKKVFKSELKNPIIANVLLTFPMGIIILSTYLIPFSRQIAQYFWFAGIILYLILISKMYIQVFLLYMWG